MFYVPIDVKVYGPSNLKRLTQLMEKSITLMNPTITLYLINMRHYPQNPLNV